MSRGRGGQPPILARKASSGWFGNRVGVVENETIGLNTANVRSEDYRSGTLFYVSGGTVTFELGDWDPGLGIDMGLTYTVVVVGDSGGDVVATAVAEDGQVVHLPDGKLPQVTVSSPGDLKRMDLHCWANTWFVTGDLDDDV